MLLSDRDIRKEIESGRVKLEPYAPELIQPSSIDVRMDRYFRVFENHRYPHIDPAVEQPELTRLIEENSDLRQRVNELDQELAGARSGTGASAQATQAIPLYEPEPEPVKPRTSPSPNFGWRTR